MGITVKEGSGGSFKQAPVGNHVGRVIQIIDLGTQHNEMFDTNRRQILMVWELPNETLEVDGLQKPYTISKFYTASLHEKSRLRQDLENFRGKQFSPEELGGFDLKNVLGKACLVSVIEKNGRSVVSGISSLTKGHTAPPQFNEDLFFSLEDFSRELFESLPEGIKRIIETSPEYQAIAGKASSDDILEMKDDIPF